MDNDTDKVIRCSVCGSELSLRNDTPLAEKCSHCGSTTPPEPLAWDITLQLNWRALRLLAGLSLGFVNSMEDSESLYEIRRVLARILLLIRKHRPKDAPALTWVEEIQELQDVYPNLIVINEHGEITFTSKPRILH